MVRLGLVAAFVLGCAALGAAQQSNPKISPRDQINIEVFGIDTMKGKFRVDADGMTSFPPLEKPVKVAGLTVREVETLPRSASPAPSTSLVSCPSSRPCCAPGRRRRTPAIA
jgi:protein involved in polysaccharide export with SLBB domain